MELRMTAVDVSDAPILTTFLADDEWPYHETVRPSAESVLRRLANGWLTEPGTETFWIHRDGLRCGLLRLFDLDEGTPLFDLRLTTESRGQGVGSVAVRWLTDRVFCTIATIQRIEATTRVDNVAMRRALEAAGWVKEAHWRSAWTTDGTTHDAVGYGVLRADYETGTVTAVRWTD